VTFLAWVFTVALFLVKITRYSNPSWLEVFLPVILNYVALLLWVFFDLLLERHQDRLWRKQNQASLDARRHAAASDIQPLDSIQFPRQH
jgi:uncharacterized membrane protein